MNESIIYKCISGTASVGEQRLLADWLHASPENQAVYFEINAIWKAKQGLAAEKESEQRIDQSLRRMNQRIKQYEARRTNAHFLHWGSAAAILILLILVPTLILLHRPTQETAEAMRTYSNTVTDSICRFTLPDGSKVWLNSRSSLRYPEHFSAQTREVELEGEAFFEVVKDPVHPFIVSTDVNHIKVLGTSFSVNTHLAEGVNETILMNGSVQLLKSNGAALAILHPGEQAIYNKRNQSLAIKEVDVNVLTSWRFGLTSLTNVSIEEIIGCLEDSYHIKIKINTASLRNKHYNYSFKRSKGAAEALRQLSYMTGMPAEIR